MRFQNQHSVMVSYTPKSVNGGRTNIRVYKKLWGGINYVLLNQYNMVPIIYNTIKNKSGSWHPCTAFAVFLEMIQRQFNKKQRKMTYCLELKSSPLL